MDGLFVSVVLVTLHMIDGREVAINPDAMTQMFYAPGPGKQFPDAVECVLYFTDGKFLSVAESCEEVRKLIGKEQP